MILRRRMRRAADAMTSDVILAYPAGRPGNPYTALLYAGLTDNGWRVDDLTFTPRVLFRSALPTVLHVHWPEQVAATRSRTRAVARLLCYTTLLIRCRIDRRPVVWTVHNLHPHDSPYPRVARAAIVLTRWSASGVVWDPLESTCRHASLSIL